MPAPARIAGGRTACPNWDRRAKQAGGEVKKLLLLFLIFLFQFSTFTLKAQNLVINPSFEQYDTCPTIFSEIMYAIGWASFREDPEYFNSCDTCYSCTGGREYSVSVPYNYMYRTAASGSAYCGISPFAGKSTNFREYVGGQLSSPLIIGKKYFVSFQTCLCLSPINGLNYATNHLGAMFSTIDFSSNYAFHPSPITNNPPIHEDSLITDTTYWTRVFGSFIADSAYKYIIIGNFYDDMHTDTIKLSAPGYDTANSYYYVDDVCVSTDSLYSLHYVWTGFDEITKDSLSESLFKIYPNPAHDFVTIENLRPDNENYNVSIFNILGQELYHTDQIKIAKININLVQFKSELLFINIKKINNQYNYKLLKL
jgi:hypothetical protein